MSTDLVRNERQAEFIRLFVGSQWAGNASKCAVGAGYSEDTAKQKGYQLKRKFADKIQQETVRMIADSATLGLAGVLDLAKNASNDSVRLQACKDLLDRAGFNAINQIEISGLDKKSDEELKEELDRLLNANVIDVTPESSTSVEDEAILAESNNTAA
jgi:DNA-binding CsgD family transcriptional regulator